MADRVAFTQPQTGPGGYRRTGKFIGPTLMPILAADVGTINNTVQLCVIPAGFVVMSLFASATDMDTGGPTLTLSLGDTGSTARLLSASVIGQAGTSTATIVATAVGFKYTVDTNLQLLVAAAATTPAAGTLTVYLGGFMDL